MKYIKTIKVKDTDYEIIPTVSTENELGGIKTKVKDTENVPVAVDENGQAFVPQYPDGNGKLDIAQGVDNANKVMMVDETGNLVPTEFKGGSDNKLIGSVPKTSNPSITDGYQTEIMNLKLYGKSTQGADPSPDYPQPITAISQFDGVPTGGNLFDISKITNVKTNLINNKDGSLTINSTETSSGIGTINKLSELSNLVVGEEYILSAQTTSTKRYIYIDVSREVWEFGRPRVIKQSDLDSTLIFYTDDNNDTSTIKDIQIELGTTATPYTPYVSQPFTYTPSQKMYSTQDGSISDYVDVEKGVEVYNMKPITLNGSEAWTKYNNPSSDTCISFYYNYPVKWVSTNIMCDRFKVQTQINDTESIACFNATNCQFVITILKERLSTLDADGFKQWLSENNVNVVVRLATPTEIPIDPIQLAILRALYTYNGVTNFLCNGDVSFDYEQSVNIVIKNILSAISQTNANLLLTASKEG